MNAQAEAGPPSASPLSRAGRVDALLSQTQRKKKRRTYVARKEETAELLEEMALLEGRLALLQTTPPEQHAALSRNWREIETQRRAHAALMESAARHYALQTAIRAQQLHVAGVQSLLTSQLMARTTPRPDVPFARTICLPADHSARQHVLRGLKDTVLRDAAAFMLARRQFLDLRRTSHQAEEFDLPNGDLESIHWDVTPFFGRHTVRDAYDELLFFMMNQEMSATEHLDAVTLRENDDDEAFVDVAQARLVTTLPPQAGSTLPLTIEKNLVVFMQYYETAAWLEAPHAMLVVQSVDYDALFPYQPSERLRHDITAVVFVTAAPSSTDRPCVSMTRWAAARMHCSNAYAAAAERFAQSGASEAAADEWREDFDATVKHAVHGWCDLMLTTMKERMRARGHAKTATGG